MHRHVRGQAGREHWEHRLPGRANTQPRSGRSRGRRRFWGTGDWADTGPVKVKLTPVQTFNSELENNGFIWL